MAPTSAIRLLLADDNPAILEMLVDILQGPFVIAGTAADGMSVLREVANLNPDVIVLDVSLGDMSGFEVARQLVESGNKAKVMFLSVHENAAFVRAALAQGVLGYVFKSRAASDLIPAIHAVVAGERFIPLGLAS
jgi:DNA-binding NarL/FixJ family response regulator